MLQWWKRGQYHPRWRVGHAEGFQLALVFALKARNKVARGGVTVEVRSVLPALAGGSLRPVYDEKRNFSIRLERVGRFLVSHSQTIITRQPSRLSARKFRRSRSTFESRFLLASQSFIGNTSKSQSRSIFQPGRRRHSQSFGRQPFRLPRK